MIKKIVILLLLAVLNYAQQQTDIPWPTLADSPWPMVKHDPQFTGRSPFKGPQSPTIVWERDMENGIFSGPVIGADKNLYFGSYSVFGNNFYSYSQDGEFKWMYETGSNRPPQAGILIDSSNTIYFGSRDSCLYALSSDGSFKWKYKTTGWIPQEVILNIDLQGNIYLTNSIGELYSIKPNGELNWKVKYENGFTYRSPVMSPDGNTIYIAGIDSNLFALNLNGSIKWKFNCGVIRRAPMVDCEGNIYFIALPTVPPQCLYSLAPEGTVKWKYILEVGSLIYSIPTIDYNGNIGFIGMDTSYFRALFSIDYFGILRWKYIFVDYYSVDFWQPLICDSEGIVYVGATGGNDYYAISNDGILKWRLPLIETWQQVDNTGAIASGGSLYLGVHNASIVPSQIKTLIALRDTVTSVENERKEVISYQLEQNYPNPFNSITNIRYSIPQSGRVTLTVYDIMGSEVATILDTNQEGGSYDVIFQPKDLASGIYFYTLTSGDYMATKKLILLK